MDYYYSAVFCSDLDIVKSSVNSIIEELEEVFPTKEAALETRIILNELLINGILHGNHCLRAKCIRLSVETIGGALFISVKDEGEGIEDCNEPNDELCTYGRGLAIVKRLTDSVVIEKNSIKVKKHFI
ncbi:MAG: ATP-binding protein [Tissierellia bacterium]|nr:ATP-binding protein [Tissierellia bacterium]